MNLSPLTLCFVLLLSEAICGILVLLAVRYAIHGAVTPLLAPLTQQTNAVAQAVALLSVTQRATLDLLRKQFEEKKTTGWGSQT